MSKSIQLKNRNNEKMYPHPYYPVGSIYLSVNDTNPSTWFGGTWEQIAKGRTLVGVDTSDTDFNTVKKTGGNKNNTHNHYTALSFDGQGGYLRPTQALPRTRVITGGRVNVNVTNYIVGATREDSTYDETINIVQPYFTCYIWCRTA